MKIKVVVFYEEFETASLGIQQLAKWKDHDIKIVLADGEDPGEARNMAITDSKKIHQEVTGFDRILFVDSSIGFSVDQVKKLIEADKDVVSAAYPGVTALGQKDWPSEITRVAHCKARFLMIKPEILSRIEFPWFHREFVLTEAEEREEMSESWGFCESLGREGIEIFVDYSIPVTYERKRAQPAPAPVSNPDDWMPSSFSDEIEEMMQTLLTINRKYRLLYRQLERRANRA